MQKNDLIFYRSYHKEDEPFIYDSWLKGLRYGHETYERMPSALYFENYRKIIHYLLPLSEVRIACLKEASDTLIGYSVSHQGRLHWIHVKDSWRKIGVAKDLLPKDLHSYSHFSKVGLEILKKYPQIFFNPFL